MSWWERKMECWYCHRVYVHSYRECPDCGADQDPDGAESVDVDEEAEDLAAEGEADE